MKMILNRRQAIVRAGRAATVCALGSALMPARGASSDPSGSKPGRSSLAIGIATFGFPSLTNAELARELAEAGLRNVQLFLSQKDSAFWRYDSRADLSSLTADRCKAIADTYRNAGLRIHSIGVYTNLIHPDPAERQANLSYFRAMMEVGRHMGVRRFITEAGHYQDPKAPEPSVPLHFQDAVWTQCLATFKELARLAEPFEATVLLEPFYRSFLASAKRTRVFLEEINSPRIRALLDPANLIEVNDLDEMFQQLGPWIDCIHAKDRRLHTEAGVAAGAGSLDYPKLVALAARHTPRAPLVLEYVGPNDYRKALAHLRQALRQADVAEAQ